MSGRSTARRRRRVPVQVVANGVFQDGHVGQAVELGHPEAGAETADGRRRHPAAAQAGDRWEAGIIPAADQALADQLQQLPLAHDRVAQAQAGELELVRQRPRQIQVLQDPVIQRPVHFELQRADAVGDAFDVIAQAMRKIVHRVDAPSVPGVVVARRAGSGTAPDPAATRSVTTCRFWRATSGCHPETRRRASAGTV